MQSCIGSKTEKKNYSSLTQNILFHPTSKQ